MLNEASIKAAVIDRLYESGALDDAVLINEMVYANWTRRADLAVANGHLHAFEVKSDVDSLRRLEGQVSIYLERFDQLTLVVTPKFLDQVLTMIPTAVAVWKAEETESGVLITAVRDGKREKVVDKEVLTDYLHRNELYRFLCEQGVVVRSNQTRGSLVSLVLGQPTSKLRAYVLRALKARYRETFSAFTSTRNGSTSPQDIVALRKDRGAKVNLSTAQRGSRKETVQKVPLDLSRLFEGGIVPEDMPRYLVVRKKVRVRS